MELETGAVGNEVADARLIDGTRQLLDQSMDSRWKNETIALRVLDRRSSEEGALLGWRLGEEKKRLVWPAPLRVAAAPCAHTWVVETLLDWVAGGWRSSPATAR